MNNFYAMMSRMKFINRWALMRNSYTENISEHSLEVAMLAHGLAIIGNKRLGKKLDADRAAVIALFHDTTEIITGDMPTPIKYLNRDINVAFKDIEEQAARKLLDMLPDDIREDYVDIFFPGTEDGDEYLCRLVKAADKLSALIKCVEESKAGNLEFESASESLRLALEEMQVEEVRIFMQDFFPAYSCTLDELNRR